MVMLHQDCLDVSTCDKSPESFGIILVCQVTEHRQGEKKHWFFFMHNDSCLLVSWLYGYNIYISLNFPL